MNRIKENLVFLQAIAALPKKQVAAMLQNATRDQILSIAEVAKNITATVIKLPPVYKLSLNKHRGVIRKLAAQETTHREREEIVASKPDVIKRLIQSVVKKLVTLVK